MGIVHIVLFKWKPETTPQQITAAMEGLRALDGRIPGVLELTCGENFTDRGQGFTHGLLVRLTDREALDTYQTHPEHQAVVQEAIRPFLADIIALDYEI